MNELWTKITGGVSATLTGIKNVFTKPIETTKAINTEVMMPVTKQVLNTAGTTTKNIFSGFFEATGLTFPVILILAGGIGVLLLARKFKV